MADSGQEFSGKNLEEVIAEGLARLNLTREQAEIEVLSRGSRGIFGLGSEPARVRIMRRSTGTSSVSAAAVTSTPTPAAGLDTQPEPPIAPPVAPAVTSQPTASQLASLSTPATDSAPSAPSPSMPPAADETPIKTDVESSGRRFSAARFDDENEDGPPTATSDLPLVPVSEAELAELATELLNDLIRHMGFRGNITSSWQNDDSDNRYLLLDIHGSDVHPLIGRRGETLASIQYLVRLMVNQRIKQWKNIVVDVEQYKERRVNQLTQLAMRMADQVADSGRAVSLEPMPANERRIVHMALRDHPTVYTQSSGDGERRKVHILARS